MRKLKAMGLVSLGLAFAACQQDDRNPSNPPVEGTSKPVRGGKLTDAQYLEMLRDRGLDTRDARILEEGIVVEGDIYIPKADLDARVGLAKAAQREIGTVAATNANRIRIRINPSIAAWNESIQQAINFWNSVQSNVVLNIVTGTADIIVAADTDPALPADRRNLPSNVCGMAGFPAGGLPYRFVSMNMDQPILMNDVRERISNIAHEIGHTIGLAHTNSVDGTLIPGTPGTDGGSTMNGGSCGILDDNLSDWDRKALLIKYPKDQPLWGTRIKEGDNREDLVVFRHSDGTWYVKRSSTNFTGQVAYVWGGRGDVAMPKMDVDGDSLADLVYWRPSTGNWHFRTSMTNYTNSITHQWGTRGDIPLGGMDVDFDGKSDLVVWRWTDTTFYVKKSSTNYTTQFAWVVGTKGDIPLADTDLDKDGKDDLAVWRPSNGNWVFRTSASNFASFGPTRQWGSRGDVPVSGTDHDGDRRDEMMVFRPLDGTMYMKLSGSNYTTQLNKVIGTLGDYPLSDININGDGLNDLGIWRRSGGHWRLRLAPNYTIEVVHQWGS